MFVLFFAENPTCVSDFDLMYEGWCFRTEINGRSSENCQENCLCIVQGFFLTVMPLKSRRRDIFCLLYSRVIINLLFICLRPFGGHFPGTDGFLIFLFESLIFQTATQRNSCCFRFILSDAGSTIRIWVFISKQRWWVSSCSHQNNIGQKAVLDKSFFRRMSATNIMMTQWFVIHFIM